jgi:two-component system, chemotaxis family, protein-glutamate methylesterase/glutaminase
VRPVVPISVMVVDDSVVMRRLVSDILDGDQDIEVVGTAANGKVALAKIPALNPDVVTLDVEMPVMDGLQTLTELRKLYPRLPVIMFSTLTERGASATLDALERGASDYVSKPANVGSITASMDAVRAQLVPKIKALAARGRSAPARVPFATPTAAPRPVVAAPAGGSAGHVDVVVIGVSTGGPDALTTLIPALPGDFPVPIAVVQHMPPIFTDLFAKRLDTHSQLHVAEARAGDRLAPGEVLIAPGDFHLRLRADNLGVVAQLDQGTPENYCRPSVDVLFRSAPEAFGASVLAVVLTGMGSDGAKGAARIVEAGGSVIVQDAATSVVWGMPGAVANAGLASQVLPLRELAGAIQTRVNRGRRSYVATGGRFHGHHDN